MSPDLGKLISQPRCQPPGHHKNGNRSHAEGRDEHKVDRLVGPITMVRAVKSQLQSQRPAYTSQQRDVTSTPSLSRADLYGAHLFLEPRGRGHTNHEGVRLCPSGRVIEVDILGWALRPCLSR